MADRNRTDGAIEPNDDVEQGERSDDSPRVATPGMPGHTAPLAQHEQHTRKGQAQSPRELNHHEPPKKKEGHQG